MSAPHSNGIDFGRLPDDAIRTARPSSDFVALDLPAEMPTAKDLHHPQHGAPSAIWVYRRDRDTPLFLTARFDFLKDGVPEKEVCPFRFGEKKGRRRWHMYGPETPSPLYGLDLLADEPTAPVLVVEGEKAADAAMRIFPDHVAVTSQGGSNAAAKADWRPLAGRDCLIWPDNDAGGQRYAQDVVGLLKVAGARSYRVVDVPKDWPKKWDVADPLPPGVTVDDLQALATVKPKSYVSLWQDTDCWVEEEITPRRWLARNVLQRGTITMLSGGPGISKSGFALASAVALTLQIDYASVSPSQKCRVLVFNVEDDRDEQCRRLSAILRYMGSTPADLEGRLLRAGPTGVGTLIEKDMATGKLRPTECMEELEGLLISFKPDVVCLDPLIELHTAEENDNGAQRAVLAQLRALAIKYDFALMLIHHSRKGSSASPGDMDTMRGASSIAGAARIVLTITNMASEEATKFGLPADAAKHFFRLDSAKQNYAAAQDAVWLERVSYSLTNGDTAFVAVPWKPPADVVTLEMRVAIEGGITAGCAAASGEPWSAKFSSDLRSVASLFAQHGVKTRPGQVKLLAELVADGFQVVEFTRSNRTKAQGIRSPSGHPMAHPWSEIKARKDG